MLTAPTPPPPQIVNHTRSAPPPVRAHGKAAPTYVVRRGENLGRIAQRLGCHNVTDLAKANGIKPKEYGSLRAGRVLQVGVCTQ